MPEVTRLDVLAIAAHPDDAEITCGGFLLKMAERGRRTGVLDLARGEAGTFGDQNERVAEATAAARILGLTWREQLGLPDSAIEYNHENKLKIAAVIRRTRPELIVLPHWEQRHPDHLACTRLGYDACFLAGLRKADIDGEPFRPRKIIYVTYFRNSDYSFLVDITDQFEKKCEAVAAYKSQFENPDNARKIFRPGVDVFEFMQARARHLGTLVGVTYAEAFTIKEHMLVDDPQKMPVQSI